jgi:small-conductance mechanosensitive channel
MNELLSGEMLAELGALAYDWVQTNVLVVGNAVQLLVAVLTLGAAVFVARRALAAGERVRTQGNYVKLISILLPLTLPLIWLLILWLCIVTASTMQWPHHLLRIVTSLLTAWVVIRLVSQLVRNPILARGIAWTAWTIAALSILNLLEPTIEILDAAAISFGDIRISLYMVITSTLALVVLLSLSLYVAGMLESRIHHSRALSPSLQVLFAKALKTVLITLAVLIAIRSVGIDLTALAVFGGAIALGVGFGLQKVVSNLVSGLILLVDNSIKPGDVIAVSGTYGWVTALGGRYVSIVTRDGVEHLIPNETLIAERVENWTHSDNLTRLKQDVGIHYHSDVHKALELCVEAATEVERVLKDPEPKCLIIGFGDSSVDLQLRFWIRDAHEGVQNVKSAILLRIWEKFHEHGIEIPYPQRDLHLRSAEGLAAVLQTAGLPRAGGG